MSATTGKVYASFSVKNTGGMAGTEIAQLYVADDISSVVTPNKQLQGFERVELEAGAEKRVTIVVDVPGQLRLLNREWDWVVEPGSFSVMVGPSAANTALTAKFAVA